MVLNASNWFSERCEESGSAFSLSITVKLHEERSEFQHIEVYQTTHWGRLLVIDGFIMLTSRDNFVYHEMMAHPVLHTHPDPQQVVIIGGGDCGTLREVLKHSGVKRAVQVDIDERVTRVSEQYFPELCESNGDARAELLFADGIRYVEQALPGSIDVIIVDSTDPVGPGKVLFTESFYQACGNALGPQGLLVQQSESPLLHLESIIKPMHQRMRAAGFHDSRSLQFPVPVYPSGWWTCTMAAKEGSLEYYSNTAAANFKGPTRYYNAEVHRSALATPQLLKNALTDL